MIKHIEKINKKVLIYISLLGIIGTLSIYVYTLFIPADYRILLVILFTIFAYLFCISQKANPSQIKSFVMSILLISFLIVEFTDFYFEHHYSKNDWKTNKGYIDEVDSKVSKYSSDIIYYHFYNQTKKFESAKPKSIMLNFGFRKSDSIYVVYSESNPLVNDIYSLESGPNLHDREYFLLYFLKNNSLLKWTIICVSIWLLFNYFSNRKKGYYPIKK